MICLRTFIHHPGESRGLFVFVDNKEILCQARYDANYACFFIAYLILLAKMPFGTKRMVNGYTDDKKCNRQ